MGRIVVAHIDTADVEHTSWKGRYLQLEKINCGKCRKCKGSTRFPHGPYWYAYGAGKSRYIGKQLPNGISPTKIQVSDARLEKKVRRYIRANTPGLDKPKTTRHPVAAPSGSHRS